MQRVQGHNEGITCAWHERNTGLFITGGSDNNIVVWNYNSEASTNVLSIMKIKEIPIESTLGEFSKVQSVCYFNYVVYVGIKNGSIYQAAIDEPVS